MTPPRPPKPPGRRRDEDDDDTVVPFRSRSTISEAREYTPRGSTIRESARRDAAQQGESPGRDKNVPAPRAPGSRITRPRSADAAARGTDGRTTAGQPSRTEPQRRTEPPRGADASRRGDAARRADPSRAEPRRTDPRRTDPRGADPRRTDSRGTDPRREEPSRAEPRRSEPSRGTDATRRAEPSRAEQRAQPDAARRADGARRADASRADSSRSDASRSAAARGGETRRRVEPPRTSAERRADPRRSTAPADDRSSSGRRAEPRGAAPRRTDPSPTDSRAAQARSTQPRSTQQPGTADTRGTRSRAATPRDADPRRTTARAADPRRAAASRDADQRRATAGRDADQRRATAGRDADPRRATSRGTDRTGVTPSRSAASRSEPAARTQRAESTRTQRTDSARTQRADSARTQRSRTESAQSTRGTTAGRAPQKATPTRTATTKAAAAKAAATKTTRATTPRKPAARTTARTPLRTATSSRSTGLDRKRTRPKRPAGKAPRRPRRLRVPRLGDPARRLRFATAVILLLFGVLAGRLVQIQASDGATYAALAATGRMTVPLTIHAPRGAILDRAGNPLAVSVDAVAVDADPKHVTNPAATARALTALIGVPESRLLTKLARKTNDDGDLVRFVYLARGLDPEVGQAVKALKLAGVNVRKEQRRDVPSHDLAANIVGFTGWDGNGQAGIEASYDDVLRGIDGSRQYETGRHGEEIPDGLSKETPAKPGRDVMLTIDRDLQYQTLSMLSKRIRDVGAYNGTAVVLDARTGEILAMASYPTYDAAKPGSSTESTRLDLATGSVLEPGSVHKAVTIGAGLQEGVIKPDTVLTIGPTIRKGNQTFRDSYSHPVRGFTLMGILTQSSNVGTITIADKLGADKLYEYQRKFGLGSKTGIGLPGESAGLVQPPSRWSDPSYGTIPIGLGVAVTPLQMTSVYATIANDGVRVTPTLVKGTENANGTIMSSAGPKSERVLSVANARALRTDLEGVPTKFGTGKKAAVPGYRVAGKTGTGKRTQNSKYLPGDVSSFIGMVPADSPRYVIGIFTHGPGSSGYQVSAPAFSELASFTLRHYGVAPSGSPPPPIRIYGG